MPTARIPHFCLIVPWIAVWMVSLPSISPLLAADPIVVATGKDKLAPMEPQAAIDEHGTIHLAYGVGNRVFYCRSTDRGKSFEPGKEIASVPNLSLGMRRGPRIVAASGIVAVSIIGGEQGKGRDGDLLVWNSKDGGSHWNGPAMVNHATGSAREGLHSMAISHQGTIWCTWLDLRNKKTEVFVSSSSDGGKTWKANDVAYESPEKNVCECCHPTIAVSGEGVGVMFRNSLKGNRDMYVAIAKNGKEFAPAFKLDAESWKLNACPMDGGMMVLNANGEFDAAWMRNGAVYQSNSNAKGEEFLGKGNQPWIAKLGGKAMVAWTSGKRGDLNIFGGPYLEKRVIQGDCSNPCIASGGSEKSALAVVCWESRNQGESSIHVLPVQAAP
ncbi:MAG: sialidase family protein [Pirellula sp.]